MRKLILKILAATFFVPLMLSSCLGDNNSKIENGNALAYIKETDYRKLAVTDGIAFSNDYVSKLQSGEFYYLDFSVHTKDGQNSDGSYIARSVGPGGDGSGRPVVRGQFQMEYPQNKVDVYPTQMNVSLLWYPYKDGLDDNWVFDYECKVYTEDKDLIDGKDNIRLVATVLEKDQYTGTGDNEKPLDKNKVIVRLYLERYDNQKPVDTTKDKVAHRGTASVKLSGLRSYLTSRIGTVGENGALGIIQFNYIVNANKDKEEVKEEVKSIGNLSEERPLYYMVITE